MRPPQAPATVRSSTLRVGASAPALNSRSSAAWRRAKMSFRLPATVIALTEPSGQARADPVARAGIKAGKTVRGGERDAGAAPTGFGPFGIGHAMNRERGFFGGARPLDQHLDGGLLGIEHVEAGPLA